MNEKAKVSRLQAYAVDVVTVEEAIQYAQSAAAEAYKEAKEAKCSDSDAADAAGEAYCNALPLLKSRGNTSLHRDRRRWCCDAVPVGPRGCGAALRGEAGHHSTRGGALMTVTVTLWYVIGCPRCMAEVERVTRAAVRDGQVTKLTSLRATSTITTTPRHRRRRRCSKRRGNRRCRERSHSRPATRRVVSKMRDAEHEVIAAAECVSHTYRAYAGYTVPLRRTCGGSMPLCVLGKCSSMSTRWAVTPTASTARWSGVSIAMSKPLPGRRGGKAAPLRPE